MSDIVKHKQGKLAVDASQGGSEVALPRVDMAFDPIEAALRQLHDRIASEQIPDDFLSLLDQLEDGPGA